MTFEPTDIEGLTVVTLDRRPDERGDFLKTYHSVTFSHAGIALEHAETYLSVSGKDVLRGMHFQLPPGAHEKLVCCVSGRALDVVLDLRKASLTFGRYVAIELDGARPKALHLAKGLAHGFLSLEPGTVMHYAVSTVYDPELDAGVRWNSFGMDWPVDKPLLSPRDRAHPPFNDFASPF